MVTEYDPSFKAIKDSIEEVRESLESHTEAQTLKLKLEKVIAFVLSLLKEPSAGSRLWAKQHHAKGNRRSAEVNKDLEQEIASSPEASGINSYGSKRCKAT